MPSFIDRLKHSWNAFLGRDPTKNLGNGYSYRPDRRYMRYGSERSIVATVYNRIAVDAASIDIEHVRVNDDKHYIETIKSGLNECLTTDANVDQTGRAFIQDVVMSMFDEGVVAIVITDADNDPRYNSSYDIRSMRVGQILEWYPEDVKVRVYNEKTAQKEDLILPKSITGIVENPFYDIMNKPNSTLQRLIRTLSDLDLANKETSSGKLNMIIQLPYVVKSKTRQEQAEQRRQQLEDQMTESKLGIGYTDGTEKIVQLNRPIENNLWKQAQDLTDMLFSQLGLTPEVFNGTASPQVMTAYYDRTIKPILAAITEEMVRKFLTKTARTQGQTIKFFRNPFGLIPIGDLAQVVDALSRNSVVTPNEFRSELGFKPSEQPIADDLSNKNMPANPNQIQNGLTNEETQAAYESAMADLNVVDEALSMDHSDEPSAPARSRDRRVKSNSRAPTFIPGNRNKKKQYIDQLLKT